MVSSRNAPCWPQLTFYVQVLLPLTSYQRTTYCLAQLFTFCTDDPTGDDPTRRSTSWMGMKQELLKFSLELVEQQTQSICPCNTQPTHSCANQYQLDFVSFEAPCRRTLQKSGAFYRCLRRYSLNDRWLHLRLKRRHSSSTCSLSTVSHSG